ncbi:hypothetical protein FACS1894211_01670 [Clostridia bacterium]|nr:hypothetical protein FACS1894211_01670 [Clostridia bacterium]
MNRLSAEFIKESEAYYREAAKHTPAPEVERLSALDFCARYDEPAPWRVGPFVPAPDMTFQMKGQWRDPLDFGWRSGFVFNPSLIPDAGKLYMFYRAAPHKETMSSRIGLAVYENGKGWTDYGRNPVIFPEYEHEVVSTEDPKVYRAGGRYVLFYNGIWKTAEKNPSVAVDMCCAVSDDLLHWEKRGIVVPREISKLWVKAAVIPKDAEGNAVKLNGKYLMYISEGCGGVQYIGLSDDLLHWEFEPKTYLDVSAMGALYEVACAIPSETNDDLVLDFFYSDKRGQYAAGQALYSQKAPFTQKALAAGGCLSWGGLVRFGGRRIFAQGWDAKDGENIMYFYECLR